MKRVIILVVLIGVSVLFGGCSASNNKEGSVTREIEITNDSDSEIVSEWKEFKSGFKSEELAKAEMVRKLRVSSNITGEDGTEISNKISNIVDTVYESETNSYMLSLTAEAKEWIGDSLLCKVYIYGYNEEDSRQLAHSREVMVYANGKDVEYIVMDEITENMYIVRFELEIEQGYKDEWYK